MERWLIQQVIDLDAGKVTTGQQYGHPLMMHGDALGHVWRIEVRKGGKAVDLTGAAVTGSFVRADGYTVLIDGDITATGTVEVVLHPSCYIVPGMLLGFVKVALGDMVMPLSQLYFNVQRGATDMIVDPSNKIPSIEQLLQLAAQVEALTAALETAEVIRVDAENTRVANEETRETNEEGRIAAEAERVAKEAARAAAETQRSSKEQLREQAESGRVIAEGQRANAESLRLDAERQRQAQEAERQTNTQEAIGRADGAATRANAAAQAAEDVVDDVAGAALDVAMQAWPREVIDPQHPLSTAAGSHMGVVADEDCTVLHAGSKNINTAPMELGRLASDGGLVADNNCVRSAEYVPILPGITYTVSNDKGYVTNVYQYDSQYAFIATDGTNTPPYSFTAALNAAYIKVRSASGIGQNDTSVIYQVEIGSVATGIVESVGAEVITMQAAVPRTILAYGNDRLTASNGAMRVKYNPSAEQNQRDTFVHTTEAGEQLVTATGAVPHKGLGVAIDVVATQETRPQGKNLLDKASPAIGLSGLTIEETDTGIKVVNGADTATNRIARIDTGIGTSLVGKTITLSLGWEASGSNLGRAVLYWMDANGVLVEPGMAATSGLPSTDIISVTATVPTPPTGSEHFCLLLYGNVSGGSAVVGDYVDYHDIQIEIGATATSWEPYTPAMPSPPAPSPIKDTELMELGHSNSNLLPNDISKWITGGTYAYYKLPDDGVYTLRLVKKSDGAIASNAGLGFSDTGDWSSAIKTKWAYGNGVLNQQDTTNVYAGLNLRYVSIYPRTAEVLAQLFANYDIMLTPGAGADYVAPQSHTTTYASDKALNGLPGAPDTVDFGAGVETRRTHKIVLDGTEAWGAPVDGANGAYRSFTSIASKRVPTDSKAMLMSSHFMAVDGYAMAAGTVSEAQNNRAVWFAFPSDIATTRDEWQAYLAAQYAAGTPVTLVYALATPITAPINVDTIPAYGGTEHVWCEDAAAVRVGYDMTNQAAYDKLLAMMAGGAT